MPIYDYVCSACRHRTEVIHGINEDGPRFCPACGAEGTLRKGISAPSFQFKGSGWAKKDRASSAHRSASARSSAGDGASPASEDSGSGARSTDVAATAAGPSDGPSSKEGGSRGASDGSSRDRGGSKPSERSDRSERTKPAPTTSNAPGGD